jgi:hypothetical protein
MAWWPSTKDAPPSSWTTACCSRQGTKNWHRAKRIKHGQSNVKAKNNDRLRAIFVAQNGERVVGGSLGGILVI